MCHSMLAQLNIDQVDWVGVAEEQNLQDAQTAYARWDEDRATTTANLSLGFYYSILKQLGDPRIDWKKIADERGVTSAGTARMRWIRLKDRFEGNTEAEEQRTATARENANRPARQDAEESPTGNNGEDAEMTGSTNVLEENENQGHGGKETQDSSLLLWVLQEMRELRRESRETKEELQKTKQELQQSREELQQSREELQRSREETKSLCEKVDKLESTLSTRGSAPARSYAEAASPGTMLTPSVAITPPDSRPSLWSASAASSNIGTANATRTNARATHATPEAHLDMRSTQWNGKDTAQLVQLINAAMHDTEGLEGRNCRGIRTRWMGKVALIFGDEDTVQKVYAKEPWKKIQELDICNAVAGASRTYKVKGTQVPTEAFESENLGAKMRKQYVENLARENEIRIKEIRKLTPTSRWGEAQVVILCDTEKEQRSMLDKGGITMGGRWIPVNEFFESNRPRQCFRCWKLGHFAASCRDEERCLRCGEPGHKVGDCMGEPRCINCQGSHAANDKKCRPRSLPGQTTDQSQ